MIRFYINELKTPLIVSMQMTVRALFFSDTRTVALFLLQIYFFSAPRLIWASDRLQSATYGTGSGVGLVVACQPPVDRSPSLQGYILRIGS
jgi:hypothetical protein